MIFILGVIAAPQSAPAHDHPAYSNDATLFCGSQSLPDRADWMANVPGDLKLSELCIPGTHQTMSRYWGDAVECQEFTLGQQLEGGIRAIDVRIRQDGDALLLYHGNFTQYGTFGDESASVELLNPVNVLETIVDFLIAHPTETILMSLKGEGAALSGNPDNFYNLVDVALAQYACYWWNGTDPESAGTETGPECEDGIDNDGDGAIDCGDNDCHATKDGLGAVFGENPTLDEVRGKFVIIDNMKPGGPYGLYGGNASYYSYPSSGLTLLDTLMKKGANAPGGAPGLHCGNNEPPPSNPDFLVQNNWCFDTNWDLEEKWRDVYWHVLASTNAAQASTGWGPDKFYVNYLSGAAGSFPYFVASGHSNPCTGAPRLSTGCTDPTFICGGPDYWQGFPRTTCVNLGPLTAFQTMCTVSFEGTNVLLHDYIQGVRATGARLFTGIVMADFPGPGLIEQIIALNPALVDPMVTTLADDGSVGSLRVILENCWPGTTVIFDPSLSGGTITLDPSLGRIQVNNKSFTIDATALPGGITIDAGGASDVFWVGSTFGDIASSVVLRGLTITGAGSSVAAVTHFFGDLTIDRCTVRDNAEVGIASSGAVQLRDTTIHDNGANGISCIGNFDMTNCTVAGNGGPGVTIEYGGTSTSFDGEFHQISYSTIADNELYGLHSYGDITLRNCIIAGNPYLDIRLSPSAIVPGPPEITVVGSIILGNNLLLETTFPAGAPNVNGHYVEVDPQLAPLGDYGGPTWTMPPRLASPAIDRAEIVTVADFPAVEDTAYAPVLTDARGMPRPSGSKDDLGAVERSAGERVENQTTFQSYPTLQAAIDTALPGDDLLAAPSTYTETIDFGGKAITLRSVAGPNQTVIDGGGAAGVVRCLSGEGPATVLEGFTITGGSSAGNGGGFIVTGSAPTIRDCRIEGNNAAVGAGAYTNDAPTFRECIFAGNTATTAGALFADVGASPLLVNCQFVGNTAQNGAGAVQGPNLTVVNSTFTQNSSLTPGGALVPEAGSIIANSIFWQNDVWAANPGVVTVHHCLLDAPWTGLGSNNLVLDPLFVDPNGPDGDPATFADNDYGLAEGSPAIDAGDNAAIPVGVLTDLTGGSRILDDPGTADTGAPPAGAPYVDIGAQEFNPGTILVGPGGYATIQEAIDLVQDGTIIEVAPGVYPEAIDFLGKAITLRSSGGPAVTTIDGPFNSATAGGYVVRCTSGEGLDTILEGFTITGGTASYSPSFVFGGGMLIENSSPTVRNCVFEGNQAGSPAFNYSGGGMLINAGGGTLSGCTFRANNAESGAGLHASGDGLLTMERCTFVSNTGGPALVLLGALLQCSVRDCRFLGNNDFTGISGGAVRASTGLPVEFTQCIFAGNVAGFGAGLYVTGPASAITSCVFYGNTALSGGGGLVFQDLTGSTTGHLVANCLFRGNTPEQVSNFSSAPASLYVFRHNALEPLSPGVLLPVAVADGGGNIGADPLFVDPEGPDGLVGTEDDDYRLSIGSPCADAGNNADVPAGVTTDLAGAPRFADDATVVDTGAPANSAPYVDIGAYESDSFASSLLFVPADVRTIQQALALVSPGGEVVVDPGTYLGPIDFAGKLVTLRSSGGPEVTILDGQGLGRVLTFDSGESTNTVVDGFTITGGDSASEAVDNGGAMLATGSSSPLIRNCRFIGNVANLGGAVYTDASPIFERCSFEQNAATLGGAIYCIGATSSPTVESSVFSENSAESGGGLLCQDASALLVQCLFVGNTVTNGGGGFAGPDVTAIHCTFSRNTSPSAGSAAVPFEGCAFENCIIFDNPSCPGCDLWTPDPSLVALRHCIIQGGWTGAGMDNIDADPLFVDPNGPDGDPATVTDNDYRIGAGSPAIDAADSIFLGTNVPLDLAGALRAVDDPDTVDTGSALPSGAVIDIGAYEYQGSLLVQAQVVVGTGAIGDGVTLSIASNGQWVDESGVLSQVGGFGFAAGGGIESDAVTGDIWFRGSAGPIFPGIVDPFAEWLSQGAPVGGAIEGPDNWLKVVRDGDGAVSWAQCVFDFSTPQFGADPVLVSIPLYVTRFDGADFTLAEALEIVSATRDGCPGALASGNESLHGSLVPATSGGLPSACAGSGGNADHWWQFTALEAGDLDVSTCGTHDLPGVDLGMDTVLAIYTDCAGILGTMIACNDDAGDCGGLGLQYDSHVTLAVGGGETVYVRLSHHSTSAPGEYLIHFDFQPLVVVEPTFIRGDANGDGTVNIADAIATLAYLFSGGPASCIDALDTNDDGQANIADAISTLGFLFSGGPPPAPPFPAPGTDPTADPLGC